MGRRRDWLSGFALFAFFTSVFAPPCSGQSSTPNFSIEALDSVIRDRAFEKLANGSRTGVLYNVSLPPDLSGVEASVVRLRIGSFWARGATYPAFRIPPRTMPDHYVRRLAIVYHNLGNLSNYYFNVPGYSSVTPVVGFLAYDASRITTSSTGVAAQELDLNATGSPISVKFPPISLPPELGSAARCVRFGSNGSIDVGEPPVGNSCTTTAPGHLVIVAPLLVEPRSQPPESQPPKTTNPVLMERQGRKGKGWWRWLWVTAAACGGGVVGAVVVGLVAVGISRLVRRRRMEEMERRAWEGEVLGTTLVRGSKMPSAGMIRTRPALESGGAHG